MQLLCLGEPLIEFNERPDGSYQSGFRGDVSNVAIAAARQGTQAGILTHVGQDPFGDGLIELWKREDVDVANVKSISGQDTGLYFVNHDESGHHFVYRRKGLACSFMTPTDISEVVITDSRMLYTSGISFAVSDSLRGATIQAISFARRRGVLVAIDPNLREQLWPLEQARAVTHDAMRHCDIALPGLDDARRLTGLQTPEEIVYFYHGLGAEIVALTLGADGVAISTKEGLRVVPGAIVDALDATGAGTVLMASSSPTTLTAPLSSRPRVQRISELRFQRQVLARYRQFQPPVTSTI